MHEKMAEWPIKKLVISMSGPAVISMMVQGLYNVVDGFFLARLGQSVITAIAIAIPFFYIVFCIGIALGIGANSLISRRLGAKKIQEAGEVVEVTLLITCILGIIATIGGVVFSAEFMSIFTADSKVIAAGSEYISALSWFFIPILGAITTEKMIQATGEMKFPMYTSVLGGVINMILDPILIFGLWGAPKMGIIGAAHDYFRATGRRVSIEYALIKDMNDHAWRARLLADELNARGRGWAHVNPIPLNPTPGSIWTCSEADVQDLFVDTLRRSGIATTVRDTRGSDIDGACGQLATEVLHQERART